MPPAAKDSCATQAVLNGHCTVGKPSSGSIRGVLCGQDVSGGKPVSVQGTDLPLWGMEIDVAAAAEDIRAIGREGDGMKQVDDFLGGLGLGAVAEQLKDLRLSAAHLPLIGKWLFFNHFFLFFTSGIFLVRNIFILYPLNMTPEMCIWAAHGWFSGDWCMNKKVEALGLL